MRGNRWSVLAVGMLAQLFTSSLQFGLPFVLPQLTALAAGSPAGGALLVSAPSAGLIAALLAWGWFADRFGERIAMLLGLSSGAAILALLALLLALGALTAIPTVWILLFLSSALLAAVNSASGRLILAWFPLHERGLAMGIRQTSQPLGVAMGAAVFPATALAFGLPAVLGVVVVGCVAAAGLILLVVPTRTPQQHGQEHHQQEHQQHRQEHQQHRQQTAAPAGSAAGSPYARPELWRTHGASALLTVGQFVFSVFGFSYLVSSLGWQAVPAGLFFSAANLVASGMRVLVGWLSDRLGSRLRPLRAISCGIAGLTLLLLALHQIGLVVGHRGVIGLAIAAALFASTTLSASNNGLSYTLVAEYAGPRWTGRALGAQNTVQNLVAAAVPPLGAACLALSGFGALLLTGAVGAGAAALLLPSSRSEPRDAAKARRSSPSSTARRPSDRALHGDADGTQ